MADFLNVHSTLYQPKNIAFDGNSVSTIVVELDARTLRTVNSIRNCWKRFGHYKQFALLAKKHNQSWNPISTLVKTELLKYKMISYQTYLFALFHFNSSDPCLCQALPTLTDENPKCKN